uniref:Hint domain-containing protein n=1 Tax=viral metagenome TaxID=1070528 RepID=A0A6M3IRW7_9ZZZZ
MKIKSITTIPFEGFVYNLGVEDDESYIANCIAVHNCRCTTIPITKFEVSRLIEKNDGLELSDDEPLPPDFPDNGFGKYSEISNDTVNFTNEEIIESLKEIVRCPYETCRSEDIKLESIDEFETKEFKCNTCLNKFKMTKEKELYLFDKVKNEWSKEREKDPTAPDFFTREK